MENKKTKASTAKSTKKPVSKTTTIKKDNTMWYIIITALACVVLSVFIGGMNKVPYEFTNINTNDLKNLYAKTESSIVYIGRPTCGYCEKYAPILKKVAYKNDLKISYLNLDNLSDDEKNQLLAMDPYFKTDWGTPLIVIVGNNKIEEAKITGAQDESTTVEFFKTNKFIK